MVRVLAPEMTLFGISFRAISRLARGTLPSVLKDIEIQAGLAKWQRCGDLRHCAKKKDYASMEIQDTQRIQQQLIKFLRQHPDVYEEFDATTDLIEYGILDSLLVTDLVLFTRKQYGIELQPRDISPEKLGSVERLAELISKKQRKRNQAA